MKKVIAHAAQANTPSAIISELGSVIQYVWPEV